MSIMEKTLQMHINFQTHSNTHAHTHTQISWLNVAPSTFPGIWYANSSIQLYQNMSFGGAKKWIKPHQTILTSVPPPPPFTQTLTPAFCSRSTFPNIPFPSGILFWLHQLHTEILIACSLAATFYGITIPLLQRLVWDKNRTGAAVNSEIMPCVSKVPETIAYKYTVVVHAYIHNNTELHTE